MRREKQTVRQIQDILVRMVADKGKFGAFAYYCCAAGSVTVILSLLKFFNLLWYKAAV